MHLHSVDSLSINVICLQDIFPIDLASTMSFHLSSNPDETHIRACTIRLWINHGHPIMAEVVKAIWDAEVEAYPHDRIIDSIYVTSCDEFFRGFEHASHSELEPLDISPSSYVEWALDFATKHGINTVFPGRYADELIQASDRFKAIGVTLLHTASLSEKAVLGDRPALYRRLQECFHGDIVPDFYTWQDDHKISLEEVVAMVQSTKNNPSPRHRSVCVMPAVGKVSKGFFQFTESRDPQQQLEHPEKRVIGVSEFSQIAHSLSIQNKTSRQWVLMEYMEGVTYSVDCLAWHGRVVAHVIREKQGAHGHVTTENEFLLRQVNIIARDFGLSGVFNAKFLVDSNGRLKLLSANPRFFGGLGMSTLAGVNLPWLWLKMHHSDGMWEKRMPSASLGVRVDSVLCSVQLPSASHAHQAEVSS